MHRTNCFGFLFLLACSSSSSEASSADRIRRRRETKEGGSSPTTSTFIESSVEFPSVYTTTIDKDLLAKEAIIADLDLLHIECNDDHTTTTTTTQSIATATTKASESRTTIIQNNNDQPSTSDNNSSSSSSSSSSKTSNNLCRVSALIHSQRELDYLQSSTQSSSSSSSFFVFDYDPDATEAITQRQLLRDLQDVSNDTEEEEGEGDDGENQGTIDIGGGGGSFLEDMNIYTNIRGYDCYLDMAGMQTWMEDFVTTAPSYLNVSLVTIGESYLKTIQGSSTLPGYDIQALRVTSTTTPLNIPKAHMLILTAVHAREYSPPELIRRWIQSFVGIGDEDDDTYSSHDVRVLLESTVIHWIPYVNPDGRAMAETTQPFRRKNMNPSASGSEFCFADEFGVDLNRNFPFRWGRSLGSSGRGCTQTYRGGTAGSEPETVAVENYAKSIFPESQRKIVDDFGLDGAEGYDEATATGLFLDIHSFGNYYIFPWGFENSQTPNHNALETMVSKISSFTGYTSRGPGFSYTSPASGATDDFAYGVLGAAGMTWEIGTAFHQDCQAFESVIAPNNIDALTYTAKLAHRPYTLAKGPDITRFAVEPQVIAPGEEVKITVAASNDALSNIRPAADQDVREIRVYFDAHPFSTSDSFPYIGFDASLISPDGVIDVSLDMNGISLGPHVLYAQAVDTNDNVGPVAAVTLSVQLEPSATPSLAPSTTHSSAPTAVESEAPTRQTSSTPTNVPSVAPSISPSLAPTMSPSKTPIPSECADSGSPICDSVNRVESPPTHSAATSSRSTTTTTTPTAIYLTTASLLCLSSTLL